MLNSFYGVNAPWEYRRNFENENRPGEFDRQAAAYREVTVDGLIATWTQAIPNQDKSLWRDPAVAKAYQQMALANAPTRTTCQTPSVRIPGAFRLEAYNLSRGQKYWNGADIRVPTLFIRGSRPLVESRRFSGSQGGVCKCASCSDNHNLQWNAFLIFGSTRARAQSLYSIRPIVPEILTVYSTGSNPECQPSTSTPSGNKVFCHPKEGEERSFSD